MVAQNFGDLFYENFQFCSVRCVELGKRNTLVVPDRKKWPELVEEWSKSGDMVVVAPLIPTKNQRKF